MIARIQNKYIRRMVLVVAASVGVVASVVLGAFAGAVDCTVDLLPYIRRAW